MAWFLRRISQTDRMQARSGDQLLPTPTGGTDDTRRLAAFLVTILQPQDDREPWIPVEAVAVRTSRRRAIECSPEEVRAALAGSAVPSGDIVTSIIDLRSGLRGSMRSRKGNPLAVQGEELLQKARSNPPPASERRDHRRKLWQASGKLSAWFWVALGTALIGLLATGIVTLGSQLVNVPKLEDWFKGGPEILAKASAFFPDGPVPTVVPGSYRPGPQVVRSISRPLTGNDPNLFTHILHVGGVQLVSTYIRVELQGNRNEQVQVTGISPVRLRRSQPLNGVLYDISPQGVFNNLRMSFDLDSATPVARVVRRQGIGFTLTDTPYFESHSIYLNDKEHVSLVIIASTRCYSASFDLKIDYMIGGSSKTELITSAGRPFRVTGYRLARSGTGSYRQAFQLQPSLSMRQLTHQQIAVDYGKSRLGANACPG